MNGDGFVPRLDKRKVPQTKAFSCFNAFLNRALHVTLTCVHVLLCKGHFLTARAFHWDEKINRGKSSPVSVKLGVF